MHFGTSKGSNPAVRRGIVGFLVFWSACVLLGSLFASIQYYGNVRNAVTGDVPRWLPLVQEPYGTIVWWPYTDGYPFSRASSAADLILVVSLLLLLRLLFWLRTHHADGSS